MYIKVKLQVFRILLKENQICNQKLQKTIRKTLLNKNYYIQSI